MAWTVEKLLHFVKGIMMLNIDGLFARQYRCRKSVDDLKVTRDSYPK